jgi:hypothetical protein
MKNWVDEVGDMGSIPEAAMIKQMWDGKDTVPHTAKATIKLHGKKIHLTCSTEGASIGYRILKTSTPDQLKMNTIKTWDMGSAYANSNGRAIPAAIVWKVYDGESISLQRGETLEVNTMRIGYKSALIQYQMQ